MMKIKPTTILLALLALTLTGCEELTQEEAQQIIDNSASYHLRTVNYHGHSYIIYRGYREGGITHDPDCPCREKGGNNATD